MKKYCIALCFFAALHLIAVLVTLTPSDKWFIRTVDLVGEPMAYLAVLMLVLALFTMTRQRLTAFQVLPPNGSDHRAVLAHFCAPPA